MGTSTLLDAFALALVSPLIMVKSRTPVTSVLSRSVRASATTVRPVAGRRLYVKQVCHGDSGRHLPSFLLQQRSFQEGSEDSVQAREEDPIIESSAIMLRRLNWVSWWSQVILTVVSSITLLFAKSVLKAGSEKSSVAGGFLFAGSGITLSFLSIVWTWGGTRLSKRLRKTSYSRIKAANMIRRTITIGSILNLLGMLVTLIGAQQIVGLLASKLLTMQGVTPLGLSAASVSAQVLQPLDILIVQADRKSVV